MSEEEETQPFDIPGPPDDPPPEDPPPLIITLPGMYMPEDEEPPEEPPEEEPPAVLTSVGTAQTRWITKLSFKNRFTMAELVYIEIAQLDNPAASMSARQQAAMLRVMQGQILSATYIDLDRADTRGGVQQLEAVGIIGAGRAAIILDSPITEIERYKG